MSIIEDDSGKPSEGSVIQDPEGAVEKRGPGRPRKISELLGKAELTTSKPFVKKRKKRVNPGRAWSEERREAARELWRQRRSGAARGGGTEEGPGQDGILEIGPEVAPAPPAPTPKPESITQLCDLLFVIHMMASARLHIPELKLEKTEARELAVACANVSRHYQWGTMAEKTKDWLILAGATVMIYEPRMKAMRARVKAKGEVPPGYL